MPITIFVSNDLLQTIIYNFRLVQKLLLENLHCFQKHLIVDFKFCTRDKALPLREFFKYKNFASAVKFGTSLIVLSNVVMKVWKSNGDKLSSKEGNLRSGSLKETPVLTDAC